MDRIILHYPDFVDHPQSKILNEASFPAFQKAFANGTVTVNKFRLWLWVKEIIRSSYPSAQLSDWVNQDLFYYDVTRKMFQIAILSMPIDPVRQTCDGYLRLLIPTGTDGRLIFRYCVDEYYGLSFDYVDYDLPEDIYLFPSEE